MRQSVTRRKFLLIAGSSVAVGMAGCSGSNADENPDADTPSESTPTSTPDSTPTSTATPTATEESSDDADEDQTETGPPKVAMATDNQGSYFDPKGLHVEPGTTIQFVNESGSHDTTAYHPDNEKSLRIPEEAEPWASNLFTESGETFEMTLDVEGVYDYYCTPHESMGMVGRIVVGEPHEGPGTSPPDDLPPGAQEELPAIDEILENGSVTGP